MSDDTPRRYPACQICGRPMTVGQQDTHRVCGEEVGICTCRDDFDDYRQWVIENVVPVLGPSVIPTPCALHREAS